MVQYYSDRASDGGLIISEATNISLTARGWYGAPGIYTDQQIEGWEKILKAVHAKGGRMFSQLWHTGRSFRQSGRQHTGLGLRGPVLLGRPEPPGFRSWQVGPAVAASGAGYIRDSGNRRRLPQSRCAREDGGFRRR